MYEVLYSDELDRWIGAVKHRLNLENKSSNRFIAFEGNHFAGKTTLLNRVYNALDADKSVTQNVEIYKFPSEKRPSKLNRTDDEFRALQELINTESIKFLSHNIIEKKENTIFLIDRFFLSTIIGWFNHKYKSYSSPYERVSCTDIPTDEFISSVIDTYENITEECGFSIICQVEDDVLKARMDKRGITSDGDSIALKVNYFQEMTFLHYRNINDLVVRSRGV